MLKKYLHDWSNKQIIRD